MFKVKEINEEKYQDFYLDDTYYTNLFFFYVKNNAIERMKQETFLLYTKNLLTKDDLQAIIASHTNGYKLSYLLKYNYETEEPFLQNKNINEINDNDINEKKEENENTWEIIKSLRDINFKKTINMFQDLTDLVFIFTKG